MADGLRRLQRNRENQREKEREIVTVCLEDVGFLSRSNSVKMLADFKMKCRNHYSFV
jgi:hypothetical protein